MDQGYRFLGALSNPRVIPRVEFSVIVARVLAFFACLVTLTITRRLYLLYPWFSKGGTGSVRIDPNRQHYQFLQAITKVTAPFFLQRHYCSHNNSAQQPIHLTLTVYLGALTCTPTSFNHQLPRINSREKPYRPGYSQAFSLAFSCYLGQEC